MPVWVVITDEPVYMCESGEGGWGEGGLRSAISDVRHGESTGSEELSLLLHTLRFVSLTDLVRLYQFGL